jgi:hypothetical protein
LLSLSPIPLSHETQSTGYPQLLFAMCKSCEQQKIFARKLWFLL